MNVRRYNAEHAGVPKINSDTVLLRALGERVKAQKTEADALATSYAHCHSDYWKRIYFSLYLDAVLGIQSAGKALFQICLDKADGDKAVAGEVYEIWAR